MDHMIRQIDETETDLILPLLEQVQSIHAAAHPDLFRMETDRDELRAMLRQMLKRDDMTGLAATGQDGPAFGYALYSVETRESSAVMHELRLGVLHHICVDRDRRRHGIGLALVEAVKARLRAQGVPRLRTVYSSFNEPSAALMRAAGLHPLNVVAEGRI